MNIGLVGHKLLVENPAGVEKYIYYVFNNLAKIDKENNYTIYFPEKPKKEFWEKLTNSNPNFKYKVVKKSLSWIQISLAMELYVNPQDVVFYPIDTISGLLNIFAPSSFNAVCMIHDLGYEKTNEYKSSLTRIIHHYTVKYVIQHCKKLVVPSFGVRDRILQVYKHVGEQACKQDKIVIIPEGLNDNFHNSDEITKKKGKEIREKYGLGDKRYLYFLSTIQPRKNIPLMVEAFSEVIKENPEYRDVLLVLSGKYGWDYDRSINAPCKFGIKNSVKFLQRTPDEEVPVLMKESTAFINVSLEEGFGLPALEAMACETPLILSNISVYRELVGDNATYVNPNNRESIREGILKVLCDPGEKKHIREAKELSKEYTWKRAAQKTLEVFNSVVKR